ncbi:hypothetical protein AGMMS49531_05650 [Endomicrobiia bacterium]|nr:hypothetical protein AGMMS49531_05650 [Endomicrobiia bacterium]
MFAPVSTLELELELLELELELEHGLLDVVDDDDDGDEELDELYVGDDDVDDDGDEELDELYVGDDDVDDDGDEELDELDDGCDDEELDELDDGCDDEELDEIDDDCDVDLGTANLFISAFCSLFSFANFFISFFVFPSLSAASDDLSIISKSAAGNNLCISASSSLSFAALASATRLSSCPFASRIASASSSLSFAALASATRLSSCSFASRFASASAASTFSFALFLSSTSLIFSGVAVLLFTRLAFFLSQELKARLNATNTLNIAFSFIVILLFLLVAFVFFTMFPLT